MPQKITAKGLRKHLGEEVRLEDRFDVKTKGVLLQNGRFLEVHGKPIPVDKEYPVEETVKETIVNGDVVYILHPQNQQFRPYTYSP